MPSRSARFVSAVFASILAGAPLATTSHGETVAADNCLAGPTDQTPPGGHWYYRIEHSTKRHCWYLREEGDKLSRAASQNTPAPAQLLPPEPDKAMQQSVANARAELPVQTYRNEAPNPFLPANPPGLNGTLRANAPDGNAPLSVVASRWPEPSGVSSASDSRQATGNLTANSPATAVVSPPTAAVAASLAAADSSSQSRPGPIPMPLVAIVGALALAGIAASLLFKFGRAPHPRQGAVRARRGPIRELTDDDRIALSDHRGPHVLPDRVSISRGFGEARDPNDRIAEFYARISERAPT
jgi:hypothetical protein